MKSCKQISFTKILLAAILSFPALPIAVPAQKADLIFYNGKIFTSDTNRLYVHALAIKGNSILATGDDASVLQKAGAGTKTIDLGGRTVVPGFNDAHDHLGWLIPGPHTFITEFSVPGPTRAAVEDSLKRLIRNARVGQWLSGTIGLTVFFDSNARRRWLDSIAPDNPVALQLMWGHGTILNSMALAVLAIADTARDPLSGWYERQPGTKKLTGALFEGSQFPVWDALSANDPPKVVRELLRHANEELQYGITSVQDMSSAMQSRTAELVFSLTTLPVRTRVIQMPGSTENGRSLGQWWGFSGIKYVIDGTPLEQTALMSVPYPGRAGWYGRLNYPKDTIWQILREALSGNRQLMLHIVGDSATAIVIRLMRELAPSSAWRSKRLRIEHGNGIRPTQLQDLRDMGIIVVNTPQYGVHNPLQTWVRSGIPVAVGPDAMIDPFLAIQTMCTGQTDPGEDLTIEQAVIAYTRTGAYAEFQEDHKGTLTPGKLADLAVLSQDIFTIPSDQLAKTHSLLTLVNGKIVFDAHIAFATTGTTRVLRP